MSTAIKVTPFIIYSKMSNESLQFKDLDVFLAARKALTPTVLGNTDI